MNSYNCSVNYKMRNAEEAGAIGVILIATTDSYSKYDNEIVYTTAHENYNFLPNWKPSIPSLLIANDVGLVLQDSYNSTQPFVGITFPEPLPIRRLPVQIWTSSDLEYQEKFLAHLAVHMADLYKYVEAVPRFLTAE